LLRDYAENGSETAFVHQDGFAASPPAALTNDPMLRLQAWGSIEGTFRTNGQPAAGQTLQLKFINEGGSAPVQLDSSAYQVVTGNLGQFAFPKVPPERLTLVQLIPEKAPEPKVWSHYPLTDVDVRPGETALINVGGDDRRFNLILRWPENLPILLQVA
jgi:hypothetical protein